MHHTQGWRGVLCTRDISVYVSHVVLQREKRQMESLPRGLVRASVRLDCCKNCLCGRATLAIERRVASGKGRVKPTRSLITIAPPDAAYVTRFCPKHVHSAFPGQRLCSSMYVLGWWASLFGGLMPYVAPYLAVPLMHTAR